MEILIGADPEFFVKTLGKLVSGFSLIPGDKENPHPVDKGAIQVDGMALEFNIDPVQDEDSFFSNINTVLSQMAAMLPDHEFAFIPAQQDQTFKAYGTDVDQIVEYAVFGLDSSAVTLS